MYNFKSCFNVKCGHKCIGTAEAKFEHCPPKQLKTNTHWKRKSCFNIESRKLKALHWTAVIAGFKLELLAV